MGRASAIRAGPIRIDRRPCRLILCAIKGLCASARLIMGGQVMRTEILAAICAAVVAFAAGVPAAAKPFRFANDGYVNSMDPYARNETFLLTLTGNIYEPPTRPDNPPKASP